MPAGLEIERKFLVTTAPEGLDTYSSKDIDQGYLAVTDDGVEVRVRRYGSQAFLTVKSGGGRARVEEELEIDERRFGALWALTEGRRLQKVRYLMPVPDGPVIELDVYREELDGLMVAEIEFESPEAAAAFEPPAWFGREVSDDPAYKNNRLAMDGVP